MTRPSTATSRPSSAARRDVRTEGPGPDHAAAAATPRVLAAARSLSTTSQGADEVVYVRTPSPESTALGEAAPRARNLAALATAKRFDVTAAAAKRSEDGGAGRGEGDGGGSAGSLVAAEEVVSGGVAREKPGWPVLEIDIDGDVGVDSGGSVRNEHAIAFALEYYEVRHIAICRS